MKHDDLTDIPFALVEGYQTIGVTGTEVVQWAIADFLSQTPESPFTIDGETPVTAEQLLSAIAELHQYYEFSDAKTMSPEEVSAQVEQSMRLFRRTISRHPVFHRKRIKEGRKIGRAHV